jgi:hypothetical protein
MPQYQLAARKEAERHEAAATAASHEVRIDIQRADNYVLAVVLFAASLFFAGISTKLHSQRSQLAILCLGYVMFLGTAIWIATFPVSVAL